MKSLFLIASLFMAASVSLNAQMPGVVHNVNIGLTITAKEPGVYKRDSNGKHITIDSKKIPTYSNHWYEYNASKKTLTEIHEEFHKLVSKRYSNKEFLTDLIAANVITGPVSGWSIQKVYGEDLENDLYNENYFAVHKDGTKVKLPTQFYAGSFSLVYEFKNNAKWKYRNVTNPDPESDDVYNWEEVSASGSGSYKSKELDYISIMTDIVKPVNIPWEQDEIVTVYSFENVNSYVLNLDPQFNLQGMSTENGQYKEKNFMINGSPYPLYYRGTTQKIYSITGNGPRLTLHVEYEDLSESDYEWAESLVEGSISIAAGVPKFVEDYPW